MATALRNVNQRATAATLAAVAAFAACGGPKIPEPAPSPLTGAAYRVAIRSYAFDPPKLVVPLGATVTWTNYDVVPHTVTSAVRSDRYESGTLPYEKSFSHVFTRAGRFTYLCVPHPGMQGAIEVQ